MLETLTDSGPQSSGDEGVGGGGGGGGKRESKRKLLEASESFAPKRRSTRVCLHLASYPAAVLGTSLLKFLHNYRFFPLFFQVKSKKKEHQSYFDMLRKYISPWMQYVGHFTT